MKVAFFPGPFRLGLEVEPFGKGSLSFSLSRDKLTATISQLPVMAFDKLP